jgi:hypothetical protein
MTFFNLDFASRQIHTLTCDNCGLIHWFAKNIDRLREQFGQAKREA